ncbi:hypothetical protein [Streptomyces sp. x-19]|uniref:hypothetical protein n=1 Tax=Streptomyces sp. x-19 TaxID=2789280 RepID=UPI0039809D8C
MRRGPVEPGPQGGEQQQVQQPVAHHLLPGPVPADLVDKSGGQGWSPAAAEDYAEAVSPIRRGLDAHLSDGVQRALGRPSGDSTAYVSAAVAAWRH